MFDILLEFILFFLLSSSFFWLGQQWKQQSLMESSSFMECSESSSEETNDTIQGNYDYETLKLKKYVQDYKHREKRYLAEISNLKQKLSKNLKSIKTKGSTSTLIISDQEFYTLLDETNINITSCKFLILIISRIRLATLKYLSMKHYFENQRTINKYLLNMEEQLISPSFDPAQFVESHLKSSDDIDLQLTDLAFTLGLTLTENEEKIQNAQQSIIHNKDQILSDTNQLYNELILLNPIINEYVKRPLQFDYENDLYSKIHELVTFQEKIQKSLEMLDIVKDLDSIYDQYFRWIEDNRLEDIYTNIKKTYVTFQLLLELPKMNTRCGQAEKIIDLLKQYCIKTVDEILLKDTSKQCPPEVIQIVEIASFIKSNQDLLKIYRESRLNKYIQLIFDQLFSQIPSQIQVTEAHQIVTELFNQIESETHYLKPFPTNLGPAFLQEYLKFLYNYFTKYLFKKFFPLEQNESPNNLLEIFVSWLSILRFIQTLYDKALIIDSKTIIKNFFEPYKQLIPQIVKNEINLLRKVVFKKINDKEHSALQANYDKLQDYELDHFQEHIEQSFKRVNELCFSLSLEDWIFECVKLFDQFFMRLGVLLDEINNEQPSDFVNMIMDRIRGIGKKKDLQLSFTKKIKFTLGSQIQLVEVLLQKHQELVNFRKSFLSYIDSTVKKQIQSQNTEEELYKTISSLLITKSQSRYGGNIDQYFNELSLKESLSPGVEQAEQKIVQIILKLLLNEAHNQFVTAVGIEQIDNVLNSFMSHLDLIEKSSLNQKLKPDFAICANLYVSFLIEQQKLHPDNNQIQKVQIYLLQISKEIFVSQIKEIVSQYSQIFQETTIFWALLYSFSLYQMITLVLNDQPKSLDKKQLIEQTHNVLNKFIPVSVSELMKQTCQNL